MNRAKGFITGVAVAAVAGTVASQAAVLVNSSNNTPLSFTGSLDWTPVTGVNEFYSASASWFGSISLIPTAGVDIITGTALHLIAPHAGELAPNPNSFGYAFVIAPRLTGLPQSQGITLSHPIGPDSDVFNVTLSASPVPGNYRFTWSLVHTVIPEPSEYLGLGALGLVGFAAYRRFRKN